VPQTAPPQVLDAFKERFECWNDGELDLMQDMYAEDGEFDVSAYFTDTSPIRGHEALRRKWQEMWDAWEGIRMDPLEVFDVGDRRFVVDVRLWGKGRRSGAEVDQRLAWVYTLREADAKVARAQLCPSLEDAFDAADEAR
jgi:ketosteroid isomerase-like protein